MGVSSCLGPEEFHQLCERHSNNMKGNRESAALLYEHAWTTRCILSTKMVLVVPDKLRATQDLQSVLYKTINHNSVQIYLTEASIFWGDGSGQEDHW